MVITSNLGMASLVHGNSLAQGVCELSEGIGKALHAVVSAGILLGGMFIRSSKMLMSLNLWRIRYITEGETESQKKKDIYTNNYLYIIS